jgi:hypothetical protein
MVLDVNSISDNLDSSCQNVLKNLALTVINYVSRKTTKYEHLPK